MDCSSAGLPSDIVWSLPDECTDVEAVPSSIIDVTCTTPGVKLFQVTVLWLSFAPSPSPFLFLSLARARSLAVLYARSLFHTRAVSRHRSQATILVSRRRSV